MSSFILKIIALSAMLIDHTGHMLQKCYGYESYVLLREIGRIAFPLYAFMICVGSEKTRDIKKYFLRLLAFALISEFAFDLFILNVGKPANMPLQFIYFNQQNVFFTLALGVFCNYSYIYAKEKLRSSYLGLIVWGVTALIMSFLAAFIQSDYGSTGVLIISAPFVVSSFFENFTLKKIAHVIVAAFFLYSLYANIGMSYFYAVLPGLLCILLYNGQKGKGGKWFFYIFYPGHLVVLFLIWFVFIRTGNVII